MTEQCDVVVIGAGHNALICAIELARAGLRVTIAERRDHVGGMADTREFAPGFRVSGCAHYLYQMPTAMIDQLRLGSHGLTMDPRPLRTAVLSPDRAPRVYGAAGCHGASERDVAQFGAFREQLLRFAGFLQNIKSDIPPRLVSGARQDKMKLAAMGLALRRMGREDMREFLRLIASNAYDFLHETFDDDALKGGLALDAVLGTHMGPRSPNSVFTLLHRLGDGGGPSLPIGGLGAFSDALAASAQEAGVQIRLDNAVTRIDIDQRRACSVELADGTHIRAQTVVSGADPKTTVGLIDPSHIETGFARRVHNLRARGTTAKLHLALKALPGPPQGDSALLRQRMLFAPDMDYVERAFNPVKYGEASAAPVLEISIPTLADPGLAPEGQHVVSIIAQYAPYAPEHGWSAPARDQFQSAILHAAEQALPGLGAHVIGSELLTPDDIQREYGAFGGHWHHGELALDQFLFTRPVAHAAQYALPVDGVYLCSAGAHPGGNVSGLPGRNAAAVVLAARRGGKT